MPSRTPEEIRASIEENRVQLAVSLEKLRGEVVEITDWRKHLVAHQQQILVGAGVAGFVLGGGIAAVGSLLFGGKRRKARKAAIANAALASAAGQIANVADAVAAAAGGAAAS